MTTLKQPIFLLLLVLSLAATPRVSAQDADPSYVVSDLELQYVEALPFLPGIDQLANVLAELEVELGDVDGVLAAPEGDAESVKRKVGELTADGPVELRASGLRVITEALTAEFERRNAQMVLFIAPGEADVDPLTGADRRGEERQELLLRIVYDGPMIEIGPFALAYLGSAAGYPPIDEIADGVEVELVETADGYVTWRPGVPTVRLGLEGLTVESPRRLSLGAVQRVLETISTAYTERDFMAVRVLPAPTELSRTGSIELDRDERTEFGIQVVPGGRVSALRTLAIGDRIPPEERIDNPAHERIRERSPFKPVAPETSPEASVLKKSLLDGYLRRLSRHPGRRVDAALAPGEEDLTLSLDYIVAENKPLLLYAEISNTGTPETDRVRERFGLFHNQLTGNDDLLNVEYATSSFDETHRVMAAYQGLIGGDDRLRWRINGQWSDYTASDVGFSAEAFTGESYQFAGEVAWNCYQDREFFVDLIGGLRYLHADVNNNLINVSGDSGFVVPHVGLAIERVAPEATTFGRAAFEFGFAEADENELNDLGRLFPEDEWVLLRWNFNQTAYLEPIFNREAWEDISTPKSSTLAHEIAFRFSGQYAFGDRLVPQFMQVAGGLYTVRGYPESESVGDTVLIGSVAYRLHLPQLAGFNETPGKDPFDATRPFRWVPQQPFGRADWDVVLKAFVDFARTINSDRLSFEEDDTLVGAGVGIDLRYRTNASISIDWGFALEELDDRVDSGSSRLHVVGSIFF